MTATYPLKCRPIFKERIWGGRRLEVDFNKSLPSDIKIGESWELSDLPHDKTIIDNGRLTGMALNQIIEKDPAAIYGNAPISDEFPLLIKFIDARDVLSVQVHPDSSTCSRLGYGQPKTECWYIIAAEPGAAIYKGLKAGTDRQTLQKAIETGKCEELLEKVMVTPGECHFIPSGTCHAIGTGLIIAEIQQPSDTTFRLYDWNRLDAASGKPRQLHIQDGLESVRFDLNPEDLTVRSEGTLVQAPEFQVVKRVFKPEENTPIQSGTMKAHVIISGSGIYCHSDGSTTPYTAGDTFLIPAAATCSLQVKCQTICLEATV